MAYTILRGGRVLDIATGKAEFADILIEDDTIRELGPPGCPQPRPSRSRRHAGCSIPVSSTPIPMAPAISPKGWATVGPSSCC